jgi:hypothetical protein
METVRFFFGIWRNAKVKEEIVEFQTIGMTLSLSLKGLIGLS